jgi:hypothetical protein
MVPDEAMICSPVAFLVAVLFVPLSLLCFLASLHEPWSSDDWGQDEPGYELRPTAEGGKVSYL